MYNFYYGMKYELLPNIEQSGESKNAIFINLNERNIATTTI